MALKVSSYNSTALQHKIVYQSTVTQTADVDVLGSSGTLHSLHCHNSHSATIYLKVYLSSDKYVAATSEPDLMFSMPATTQKEFHLPSGLAFSQLTFWANSASATSSTAAPGGTVLLTAICQ
tara:strand:+ start:6974 stop:7339 length:366 start_codon:yes stop_codon:yes gene_type:complete